jgi:RNA polymerase sigma factor (sigma-70 family)
MCVTCCRMGDSKQMMNENEALHLARGGHREGFAALYERFAPFVFTLARRVLGDHALAEDALQETFAAAFRSIHDFRGESRVKTWIYTIAWREATRIAGRRPSAAELDPETADSSPDAFSRRERVLDVRAVIDRLPERDRAILIMAYWDDLTIKEIAGILGLAENHVKVLLFRARNRFATLWPEAGREGGMSQ